MMKACFLCRHYRRKQSGPNAWDVNCGLRQAEMDAEHCAFYEPPAQPDFGREASGLGYVWDSEFEGNP